MATQRQLWAAIESARERGWYAVNGNTLGAPSNKTERETPESIPDRWWPGATYTRHCSVSFLVSSTDAGKRRITDAFIREHPAPWVNARDRKVTFREAIAFLEGE